MKASHSFSPCSLATEVERIVRLRLRKVSADSQSIIIFATDEGSFDVTIDPAAIVAYDSRNPLKSPKNCQDNKENINIS